MPSSWIFSIYPITTDLRHFSLIASNIAAKLTNQYTRTGLSTPDWQQLFTWLRWWFHSGCRNISHHYWQQSNAGLHPCRRSDYTIPCRVNLTQTIITEWSWTLPNQWLLLISQASLTFMWYNSHDKFLIQLSQHPHAGQHLFCETVRMSHIMHWDLRFIQAWFVDRKYILKKNTHTSTCENPQKRVSETLLTSDSSLKKET